MAKQLYANNASALLAASISDSDLTIQVASGFGALFPNPGAGEFFLVTLENNAGDIEVVKITSRASDLLTVAVAGRGQEGTSAQAWTNGQARVECRITRGSLETWIQRGGDVMEGDLDMDENELQNADIQDSTFTGGQIVGTPLRGNLDDTSNEIVVPDDGTRATAGGSPLLTEDDDLSDQVFTTGMIMMWHGLAAAVPAGWAICNGAGGTPDLRNAFVRGVSAAGDSDLGDSGGAAANTPTASNAGGHDHGGATEEAEAGVPEHTHRLYVWESGSNGAGQMENFGNSGIGPARGVAGNADSNTYAYRQATNSGQDLIESSTSGGDPTHAHDITAEADHSHTISEVPTIPPFVYLYFIKKVA